MIPRTFFIASAVVLVWARLAAAANPDTPSTPTEPTQTVAPKSEVGDSQLKTTAGKEIDTQSLEAHRSALDVLFERMIGSASRAVRYDWRKANVELSLIGSQILELNNFNSARLAIAAGVPLGGLLVELNFAYVWTSGSNASEKLEKTPYRQAGRPARFEFDIWAHYAFLEGVSTPRFSFMPSTELVLRISAGFRYRFYPHQFDRISFERAFGLVFTPQLSDREIENLEFARLGGMQIDAVRYEIMIGLSPVFYFQNGLFVTPRFVVGPQSLLAFGTIGVGVFWDLGLSVGWSL